MKYKIVNKDCMQVKLPKCRLLLTDIPYDGVNREGGTLRNFNKAAADTKTFELQDFLNHIYMSVLTYV